VKIVAERLDKGRVVVVPECMDDLWHLYNIILPGDTVAARTVRRIRREGEGARPDKGERQPMFLRLAVEEVSLHKYSNRLRVKGRIVAGPEDLVSLGSFHTLNVEPGTKLEIVKSHWPRSMVRRLREAASKRGQRLIVIAVEEGCAAMAVVDDTGVDVRVELQGGGLGKYGRYRQTDEAEGRLFSGIATQLGELMSRLPEVERVVVVGPGFTKERLAEYLKQKVPAARGRLLLDHVSSGTVAGIYEALHRGVVERVAGEVRLGKEAKLMEELLYRLGKGTGKAAYGWDEVYRAAQYGAVETLLVLDRLLRESSPEERHRLEELMRQVEERAGSVEIFSSEHQAGRQLEGLGGIAGILRFALPSA